MRRIDIRELPDQTDDELGAGETYRIERDGRTVGYFLPVKRKDPEEINRALEAFDRQMQRLREKGWTDEDFEEVFDLTKPFRRRQ